MTHAALTEDVSIDSPARIATKWVREQYEAGQAIPPDLPMDSILFLASGGADELSGRYLTVSDDLHPQRNSGDHPAERSTYASAETSCSITRQLITSPTP